MYLLYILTLGMIGAELLYVINAVAFRFRGQTLLAYVKPKTAKYKQIQKRTHTIVIIVNSFILISLAYCVLLEVNFLRSRLGTDATGPLIFGVVFVVIVNGVCISAISKLSKPVVNPQGKRKQDTDRWLT